MFRRERPTGARGAAAVEFALVLPVLMLVCLGAIEWGFYFFRQEIVVNAAREGARAGSIAITNPAAAATTSATNYLGAAGITPATCTITVPSPGNSVSVTVSCPGGSFTNMFATFMPSSIAATAVMRR